MFPLLIVLFVLFIAAFFLAGQSAWQFYSGGFTEAKNTDIIRNKLFFNYNDYAEQIFKLINNENKTLQYVSDIKENLAKHPEKFSLIRTSTHIGQLKLFLSELEFLTEFLPKHDANSLVVYAGSAPSNKIYFLHTLFPNTKFILIDPAEHFILFPDGNHYESRMAKNVVYLDAKNKSNRYKIKNRNINFYHVGKVEKISKEKINIDFNLYFTKKKQELLDFIQNSDYRFYIIEDYFTNNLADLFAGLDCYFISDIRSNIHEMLPMLEKLNKTKIRSPDIDTSDEFPSDLDICWNNALHLNWLNRLKPRVAMLKFRVPWFIQDVNEFQYYAKLAPYAETFAEAKKNGIDFITDYNNKKHQFLANDKIYIQAFPGIVSTESRLICHNYQDIINYDTTGYDTTFYYYNWFYRQFAFINHGQMDQKLGIDGCNDCALMVKIFQDYAQKYHLPDTPKKYIADLMRVIRRNLRHEFHGDFIEPYKTTKQILEKQELFIMVDLYNKYEDKFSKFKN